MSFLRMFFIFAEGDTQADRALKVVMIAVVVGMATLLALMAALTA